MQKQSLTFITSASDAVNMLNQELFKKIKKGVSEHELVHLNMQSTEISNKKKLPLLP